jgi:hypothetical protein
MSSCVEMNNYCVHAAGVNQSLADKARPYNSDFLIYGNF